MRQINTRVPDISWDIKPIRREAAGYKLSKIAKIVEARGDIKSIPIGSELQLTTDDYERIIRAFKEVQVPTSDEHVLIKEWFDSLRSSADFEDIIRPYLVILNSSVTHSNLCKFKQINNPRYSIASSAIMLAARESQNIPYFYWYNSTKPSEYGIINTERLFFRAFAQALDKVNIEDYDAMVITKEDREALIKDSNPIGWGLKPFDTAELLPGAKWHYYIKHMKLGTWIFHDDVRDENSMIFHPTDWNYVPERKVTKFTKKDDILL